LNQLEIGHPEQCTRVRDDGQFFGFKEVGEAHLERDTHYIPIPAVCDAGEEAAEGRGTAVSEVRDLVVESELAEKPEYVALRRETRERYKKVLPPLADLSTRVTKRLQTLVPTSRVDFSWEEMGVVELPTPRVTTLLLEDEYLSPVGKTGHGLQRAFIVAMLQDLALSRRTTTVEDARSGSSTRSQNLILGIEEPELYQHPDRQRHLSAVLLRLSKGSIPGVAEKVQVIYSTHSPLFVDLERFEDLHMFQKTQAEDGKPRQTKIASATFQSIASDLATLRGGSSKTFSVDSIKPHLQVLMTPWFNEGFFARLVALVEGTTDRGTILGIALSMGHDSESQGICVVPCESKFSMLYASLLFRSLDIPVYAVWDSHEKDKSDKNITCNRELLRFFGKPEEDFPEMVTHDSAAFKMDLFETLRSEVGDTLYDRTLSDFRERLEMPDQNKIMANSIIMKEFYEEIKKHGKCSGTLENIVSKIMAKVQ